MSDLVDFLHAGGVAVIATDTVYGLVADAHNQAAVTRLYSLKHREHKPGTLIAASINQLVELGIPRRYIKAVEQFWPRSRSSSDSPKDESVSRPLGRDTLEGSLQGGPGAVSVVVPCGPELEYLHQGVGSLAVRIPDDAGLLHLLEQTGPLQTSSANLPGQPPATTVEEAADYFGKQVELYIDGGDLSGRQPSTVVRVVDDAIEVIRPGAVKIDAAGRQQ